MKKPTTLEELKTLLSTTPFAICGGGYVGGQVFMACKNIGCMPAGFCDNYIGADTLHGLPVFKPTKFIQDEPNAIILIAIQSKKANQEILTQLEECGFPSEQIILFDETMKLFESFEFTWRNSSEHVFDWSKNNGYIEYMAAWIDKTDTSVADMGCGKEMHLRKLLPAGCRYIPVDYLSRSEDTIVCDFNGETLPDLKADVVFASGVLQVIDDPFRFLNFLCDIANKKIIIHHPITPEKLQIRYCISPRRSTTTISDIVKIITSRNFNITRHEIIEKDAAGHNLLCFER